MLDPMALNEHAVITYLHSIFALSLKWNYNTQSYAQWPNLCLNAMYIVPRDGSWLIHFHKHTVIWNIQIIIAAWHVYMYIEFWRIISGYLLYPSKLIPKMSTFQSIDFFQNIWGHQIVEIVQCPCSLHVPTGIRTQEIALNF